MVAVDADGSTYWNVNDLVDLRGPTMKRAPDGTQSCLGGSFNPVAPAPDGSIVVGENLGTGGKILRLDGAGGCSIS